MKITISIPDNLLKKSDELAKRLKVSRSQLYARAIEEYAERHSLQRVREKLDEVYSSQESELDPALAVMQWIALYSSL